MLLIHRNNMPCSGGAILYNCPCCFTCTCTKLQTSVFTYQLILANTNNGKYRATTLLGTNRHILVYNCTNMHNNCTLQWRHNKHDDVSRLFTQAFIRAQIKENIKAPCHWPLCGEFTDDRWIFEPLTFHGVDSFAREFGSPSNLTFQRRL